MSLTNEEIANQGLIFKGIVGSQVHGTNVAQTDDIDQMGITIEPPEYVIGLKTFEQYIQRDRPEGVRSEPGDLDLTVYSLRKWVKLALKGNPSILLLLFLPEDKIITCTKLGRELLALAPAFASKQAAEPFRGFIRSQMDRLLGERGQLRVNRPELVEKYGYDTKYAGHILRLAYQGMEYLTYAKMTLPMPEYQRRNVLAVRNGEWTMDKVLSKAGEMVADLEIAKDWSPLPDEPDVERVEQWMIKAYNMHWASRNLLPDGGYINKDCWNSRCGF